MSWFARLQRLPERGEEETGQVFKIGEVATGLFTVFVENGYVQHAGGRWKEDPVLRYHTDLIHEGCSLKQEGLSRKSARLTSWSGWLVVAEQLKDNAVVKQIEKDAEMVKSESEQDEAPQPADDQGLLLRQCTIMRGGVNSAVWEDVKWVCRAP